MIPAPLLAMAVAYAALGAWGAWWMQADELPPWPADAFQPGPLATAVGIGLAVGAALHLAYRPLHGRPALQPLERALQEAVGLVGRSNLLALMPGAVLAEEVLFRGAMHQAWGWIPASLAFGLAHWLPPKREFWVYPILSAVAGAAFSGAFWWSGGHLIAPFVAHLTVNGANLLLLAPTVPPPPAPDADALDLDDD